MIDFPLGNRKRESDKMKLKVEDLETRLYVSLTDLRNEVIVEDNGRKVVYVGEARKLWFESFCGLSIRGQARLTRYDRTERVESRARIARWWPPKLVAEKVPIVKDKKVWSFVSTDWDGSYFISWEKPSKLYRTELKDRARKEGIALSSKLFDLVFGPIDEELMEKYKISNEG